MRRPNALAGAAALFLAVSSTARGQTVRMVPEVYPTISDGIASAQNGDIVSVWGPAPGQPLEPPYVYRENISVVNKALTIVNRSYIPGQTQCGPSWDSVRIDGSLGNQSTVNIVGPHEVTLQGFTIAGGNQGAGRNAVNLNVARLGLAPGIYVLRLEAEGKSLSRRLIVQ